MKAKAIVLAAGECFDTSDIFPKVLLKNPKTNKTIIDTFLEAYNNNVIFILGFRSLSVLNAYPSINVVINHAWATTKSAYSLAIGIDQLAKDEIVDIYSGDYFIEKDFFKKFDTSTSDHLLVASLREKRSQNSCNLVMKNGSILSSYKGIVRNPNDPESLGIIRSPVSSIKSWLLDVGDKYQSMFTSDIISKKSMKDFKVIIENDLIYEVNNTTDYLRYRKLRGLQHEN
tara:strand:- start:179 stop:865 length:687 start_codon:yes stop_codon:yes gene_type:complete